MRRRLAPSLLAGAWLAFAPPAHAAPPGPPAPEPIPLATSTKLDAQIERRLEGIYAAIDGLAGVEVEVEAGVVHLGGSVLGLDAADQAEAIARRVEGVVAVDGNIEQLRTLGRPLLETLERRLLDLWKFLPLLLGGLLIVGGAWALGRVLVRRVTWFRRDGGNAFVQAVVGQFVRAGLVGLGILLALELMGATAMLGALLGTAGLVGLVLGVALKGTAEDYITSVALSVRKPFEPNDLINVDGQTGRVVRLTSRATILLSLDGTHVRIPNTTVYRSTMINYTRNPQRRFAFELGVSVDVDLACVQAVAVATMAATPGVLAEPGPACFIKGFADSAMTVEVSGWIDQRRTDWFKVGSEARRRIKEAFDRAGIEVPEPTFRVRTRALPEPATEAPAPAPAPAQPTPPADTADVRPDAHLREQVESVRADADDLLRSDAPRE